MAICPMCGSQADGRLDVVSCEMCTEAGIEGCCIVDGICKDCAMSLIEAEDDLNEEYEFDDDDGGEA